MLVCSSAKISSAAASQLLPTLAVLHPGERRHQDLAGPAFHVLRDLRESELATGHVLDVEPDRGRSPLRANGKEEVHVVELFAVEPGKRPDFRVRVQRELPLPALGVTLDIPPDV